MAKPEKVRYSGVSCMIDGIIAKRVQTLGINVDINRDQATELANTGVVQYVTDTPTVTIQLDTNDVGSTDTLALLCDKMFTYTATTGKNSRQTLAGIQQFIRTSSSNASYRTITETDMLNGYCTISATLNQDATAAARTVVVGHAAVTGISLNYDVSGNAAENYTLSANNKTWYMGRWSAARVYKLLNYQLPGGHGLSSVSNAKAIYFRYLHSSVPNNSTVVSIIINNNVYRAKTATANAGYSQANLFSGIARGGSGVLAVGTAAFVATSNAWSTAGAGGYSTASGTTDRFWMVFVPPNNRLWEATTSGTHPGWELESTAGAIGALRKGQIKAYLFNTNTSTESTYTAAGKALRLQTISIDVALGSDQLNELGSPAFYGIVKTTPVPVTVNVTALDSDLEYFSLLTSTAISLIGVGNQVRALTIDDFNGYNALRIEIYKENTQTTLLKTITVNNMQVSAENFNVAVGGNATQEINFVADNISIVGSGVNVTGGFYGAK